MIGPARFPQACSTVKSGRLLSLASLAAVALSFTLLIGTAEAQDKRITVRNGTHHVMVGFYARPAGRSWTANVLTNRSISPGSSVTINLGSGRGGCQYDVRAVFDDEAEQVSRGIDACKVGSLKYE